MQKCITYHPTTKDPAQRPFTIDQFFNTIKQKNIGKGIGDNPNLFLVFVEGDTDEEFWNKISKPGSIKIVKNLIPESHKNSQPGDEAELSNILCNKYVKRKNKKAIEFLFCKENQNHLHKTNIENFFLSDHAIGMVDMDFEYRQSFTNSEYDPDDNIQYDSKHFFPLFRTETRDIESLICKCGGLQKFLMENIELNLKSEREIEQDLLEQVSIIGFARYLNAETKSHIKFKCLKQCEGKPKCREKKIGTNPFCKFISDKKNLECADIKRILEDDNPINNSKVKNFFDDFIAKCPSQTDLIEDIWSICQGRDDIMQILECMISCGKIKCRDFPNRHHISSETLSKMILKAFIDNKCYRNSETIAEIVRWEKTHHAEHFTISSKGVLFINKIYSKFNKQNSDQNNPGNKKRNSHDVEHNDVC